MIRICEHCRESYTYAHTCPAPKPEPKSVDELRSEIRLLTGRLRDVQRAMQGWPS